MAASSSEIRLIDRWQRDFPLVPRPYREMAAINELTEDEVLEALSDLGDRGILSRVGAVVRPNTVGVSTLAAMRVPPERLEEVAHIVSADPGVNHNYEREHDYNLWFVASGAHKSSLCTTLLRLGHQTGCPPLDLPLERAYHIDLGFSVSKDVADRPARNAAPSRAASSDDRRFLAAFDEGLPLVARPYRAVGRGLGLDETQVIERLAGLIDDGIVSRFGLVVRHRELGYRANGMVVWDVADDAVDAVGERFAQHPFVTLCYRRPRRLPRWPYNLFCMIHGRERGTVLTQVKALRERAGIDVRDHSVLFSRRRFKQRGVRLSAA